MIFFIFFSTVLLSVYSYVGWRFIWTLQTRSLYKSLFLIILMLFYCLTIITFIFYFNKIENNITRIIAWLGYVGLGTVSLLFFIQVGADLLLLVKSLLAKSHSFDPHRRAFLGLSAKTIVG
ncbi:uncharacterized protein METZ01_LOCUS294100, partial [marine metagenome]